MRVLYISPYPPARDGIGDYTSKLAAAVRGEGHDVRVLVPRPAPGNSPDVVGAISSRWSADATAVRQSIAQFSPDIVHVQFAVAAFGSRTPALLRWIQALRRELRVPVIVTMHEVTRDIALLRAPGRGLYRSIASRSDLVIVHTEKAHSVLTDLADNPAANVVVIPHPAAHPPAADVEPAILRSRFGLGEAPILLAFGFIHVDKGLQDLVQALGMLRRDGRLPPGQPRLVIAGVVRRRQGPMRVFEVPDHLHLRRAMRQARRYGVLDQLVLTGYVPDAEVAGWFRAAEAVVLPYHRIEESGVAGIAAALRAPVLVSRVGGLAEQFGDSPWTFPARDPQSLARVLASFLAAAPEQRETARPYRQAADVTAVAEATLHAYAGALAATAGGLTRVG